MAGVPGFRAGGHAGNVDFREHTTGTSVKRGSLGTDPHVAKLSRRIMAAGAIAAAVAGGAALVLGPTACTPTWTVTCPRQLPRGAIVEREAPGNVEAMPGFLADGRGLVVWACSGKPKGGLLPHTLMRIDPATGTVGWRSETRVLHPGAFHPAGPIAMIGKGFKVMDLAAPGDKPIVERADKYFGRCALSPDGGLLAVGNGQITLYDLHTRTAIRTLDMPASPGSDLVFSPDSKRLAGSVGTPRGARAAVWNVADGRLLGDLPASRNAAVLGFSASGKTIVLRQWVYVPPPMDGPVRMAASVVVRDVDTGRELLRADSRSSICAAATRLIVWAEGKDLQVYDLDTGRLERTIPGIDKPALAGNIAAARQRLKHHTQRRRDYGFWDIATGEKLATVALPDGDGACRALSPEGRFLVVGRYPLIVLDRRTGRKILHLWPPARPPLTAFRHVVFSPDGRFLAFSLARRVGIADLPLLASGH